jgi:hypothetical protein
MRRRIIKTPPGVISPGGLLYQEPITRDTEQPVNSRKTGRPKAACSLKRMVVFRVGFALYLPNLRHFCRFCGIEYKIRIIWYGKLSIEEGGRCDGQAEMEEFLRETDLSFEVENFTVVMRSDVDLSLFSDKEISDLSGCHLLDLRSRSIAGF